MAFMTFHILGRLIPSDFHILFVHIFPYLWSGYPLNFRLKTSSSIPGWTKKPAGWGTPQWSKDWVGPSDSQIDPRVFFNGFCHQEVRYTLWNSKKWGETNPPFTEDDFMKKAPFLFRGFPISLTGGYSKRLAQKWLVLSKHPFFRTPVAEHIFMRNHQSGQIDRNCGSHLWSSSTSHWWMYKNDHFPGCLV